MGDFARASQASSAATGQVADLRDCGSRALDILTALVERPGELVSKHELMARGGGAPELNALVQRVVVTDHPRQAAEELARRWTQLSPEEIPPEPQCADRHGGQAD